MKGNRNGSKRNMAIFETLEIPWIGRDEQDKRNGYWLIERA
jgi:hypothetical protein